MDRVATNHDSGAASHAGFAGKIAAPFKFGGRWDWPLVTGFAVINSFVLLNACLHDPRIGYDATSHLEYIGALSKLHLVKYSESDEYFSPPLPYALPAALVRLAGAPITGAAKVAQLVNFAASLGLTWYLIRICRLISVSVITARGALVFLGILPVYYRTFAFIRGEPWVALFAVMATYYFFKVLIQREITWRNIFLAGVAMGLAMLSRQWGVLVLPGILVFGALIWFSGKKDRQSIVRAVSVSTALALLVSSWFYLYLKIEYGAFTAFNRVPATTVSFVNQPHSFYFGMSPSLLFSKPVRPNCANELIPIFYSEIWGDYWCFFAVFGKDATAPGSRGLTGPWLAAFGVPEQTPQWMITNYETMGRYLGRVNLVSLIPTVTALVAIALGICEVIRRDKHVENDVVARHRREFVSMILLILLSTVIGYAWFLLRYPLLGKGDTIKASYLLHMFPFIAVLVGVLLEKLSRRIRLALVSLLLLVAIHNLPVVVTHYPLWPVPWASP